MTLDAFLKREMISTSTFWRLDVDLDCFAGPLSNELVTQAAKGRSFQIVNYESYIDPLKNYSRIKIKLLEDGYHCWVNFNHLIGKAIKLKRWKPKLKTYKEIVERLPAVIAWVESASLKQNQYLWGGTLGPNFDCSGLIQSAFASEQIWLPRDAYQQEQFCISVKVSPMNLDSLKRGDLLFFGTPQNCTHVGLYRGDGFFWHSSGITNGHNGIACDGLHANQDNDVACFYRSQLRGAGRVLQSHDGSTLP